MSINRKIKGEDFILPISFVVHMFIVNLTLYFLTPETYLNLFAIVSYNSCWLIIATILSFYSLERKERFITRFHKFVMHYFIFSLAYFAIFAFRKIDFDISQQVKILGLIFIQLAIYRWLFFKVRKWYRRKGGNFVNVVVVGHGININKIKKIFNRPDYGYRYLGYFDQRNENNPDYLGEIASCYQYSVENRVDEIYCLVSQLSQQQVKQLIHFADNNFKKLKLVPDNKGIVTRAMNAELFETIPVLNLRNSPLELNYARCSKRIFDVFFSLLVIIFILSWLAPLVYIIMQLESKGPLLFKQLRHGYNQESFWCYKFRSMRMNDDADTKMCEKNDCRVTKLGKFLRRTSIDELPQFFNVLRGDMSVVGPRPHMQAHTKEYSKSVNKYLVRHYAKPGITGLAQIKGYRGEVKKKSDIINRTRLDIFYLEKWCPFLDFKIIYYTIYNFFKGEEKAF
ncbi:exopolysaccharide biosynthesis polyprenyl glycosylphosphotransferase [Gramella lutea]|uniref:Exopolysaccharide biosynthesis polyprenyl glycosylphosphotransferase n=1 Tax=Christiangramia lutea TaxID=1607951 RepID=A0A9X2ACF1_9FLAO|nr:exopolysaccharide biosynthesis polyprenyl glycosylphosphotransferase [Christiangramia lutea]MCH4824412.1 exopolysaccharide biosynthesis polyprenyl glycosylphosphotransferase [Christiangramia lutea]